MKAHHVMNVFIDHYRPSYVTLYKCIHTGYFQHEAIYCFSSFSLISKKLLGYYNDEQSVRRSLHIFLCSCIFI